MERRMEYLTEKTWNPRHLQYEIGEEWKVKIWSCNAKMRLSKDPCKIEDIKERKEYISWLLDFEYTLMKIPAPDRPPNRHRK